MNNLIHSKNIISRFILLIIILFYSSYLFAKPVDEATARKVAYNFAFKNINSSILENDLLLSSKSEYYDLNNSATLVVDYYVFNIAKNGIKAFIIVSGDDVVLPILGYSNKGIFDANNIPENASKWFVGYKNQIRYCVNNRIEATSEIITKWNELQIPIYFENSVFGTTSVQPLIKTKWDQSTYYNELCPYDANAKETSYAGCVATAMAQVMKYWNYPVSGSGFKSYSHNQYGTLSANFGGTSYNWSAMPLTLNASNYEVARLMYHCGVSVSMNYSPTGSSASTLSNNGTIKNSAEDALKQYFGYKQTLNGIWRSNYSQINWIDLLKNELVLNRPIMYRGNGTDGGHAFVCDGFDINNYFHFNWGWGGAGDAYFNIAQLNPSGKSFTNDQGAIIGIQPSTPQPFNLELYSSISSSLNPINYGSPFAITTNLANRGLGAFVGDYCAALFDTGYAFVDYVEIKNSQNLNPNSYYSNGISFSSAGSLKFLPGEYYVGVYFRETGGNWKQVKGGASIPSLLKVKISSPSNIELNSNITVSPSGFITKTQSANVNLNVRNNGSANFFGNYQVNLYNLDGTFSETINSIPETNGLNIGFSYSSPFLNFYTPSIKSSPGSYLLAAIHKGNSDTNWSLTGSTYFSNPVKVIVKNPDIVADKYESNNKMTSAYNFPVSFTNNIASVKTEGSNFHDGIDRDIYKINLPTGSKYLIKARIHDAYSSTNGISYNGDAQFSYSTFTDSSKWSGLYDDVMPSDIILNDGGIVYFNVWQFFPGTTGDYLLDLNISKFTNTPFNPFSDTLKVCSDSIILDAGSGYNDYLWNTGERTQKITIKNSGKYFVSINNNTPFVQSDTVNAYVNLIQSTITKYKPDNCLNSIYLKSNQGNQQVTFWYRNDTLINGINGQDYIPTSSGVYKVKIQSTISQCFSFSDTLRINMSLYQNKLFAVDTIKSCSSDSIELDAGVGFIKYLWSTGASTQKIKVNKSGSYSVSVTCGNEIYNWGYLNFPINSPNSTRSYLQIPNAPQLNFTNEMSILMSVNLGQIQSARPTILNKGSDNGYQFVINWPYLTFSYPNMEKAGGLKVQINQFQWFTVAAVKTKDSVFLYHNGVIVDRAGAKNPIPTNSSPIIIGKRATVDNDYFIGGLDQLSFWNKGLTTEEVRNYINCTNGSEPNCVGFYNFDPSENDLSTYKNNASFYNSSSGGCCGGSYGLNPFLICSGSKSTTDSIFVFVKPLTTGLTNFSYDSRCLNLPIKFNNQSDTTKDFTYNWQWDMGDGTKYSTSSIQHKFKNIGNYNVKLSLTSNQCTSFKDSITMQINIVDTLRLTYTSTICANQLPYNYLGYVFTRSEQRIDTLKNTIGGCDTIRTIKVTVNPYNTRSFSSTICASLLPYTYLGHIFTGSGQKIDTVRSTNGGCDTIRTINMTVNPYNLRTYSSTICTSQLPYTYLGYVFTSSGQKIDTVRSTNGGCDTIRTIKLITISSPIVSFQSDQQQCFKGNRFLFNNSSTITDNSVLNSKWSFGDGSFSNLTSPVYSYTQAGTFSVKLISSSSNGCSDSATRTVIVNPSPITAFTINDSIQCITGNLFLFTNNSSIAKGDLTFNWILGDGSNKASKNVTHTFTKSGNFIVSLVSVSNNGCRDSISRNVVVAKQPLGIKYDSVIVNKNIETQLQARKIDTSKYEWNPNTLINRSDIFNPIFKGDTSIFYQIKITDRFGCIFIDSLQVVCNSKSEIFVPKAFSPNNDGVNDIIKPLLLGINKLNYFKVFNKWGLLVYDSQMNAQKGWDGKYKNINQPVDTYKWIASGIDFNGILIIRNGNFILLR